ncbi:MAG: DUF6468 domain-containing protein [Alphaproteobacteria bacterium]|nr:DUF6468 domain-containing protein [Alphaproteobacteria bacterium]
MNSDLIGMGLDIVVLAVLGITIHVALRLSRGLNEFRRTRAEFSHVVNELNISIDRAQKSIRDLKSMGLEVRQNMGGATGEGGALIDELKIMIESGNSLAARLESLAGDARQGRVAPPPPRRTNRTDIDERLYKSLAAMELSGQAGSEEPAFSIRDRADTENEEGYEDFSGWAEEDPRGTESEEGSFQSEAERDLYEALRKKRFPKSSRNMKV